MVVRIINKITLYSMKPSKKIGIFYIATDKEAESGQLESSIFTLVNTEPSTVYKFDIHIILNRRPEDYIIEAIKNKLTGNYYINNIVFKYLNLSLEEDCFWYPWSVSRKPDRLPKLGYTSGANSLFFRGIDYAFGLRPKYQNCLFLEPDTRIVQNGWFDSLIKDLGSEKFFIYGSKYKGQVESHKISQYKDHLNGVAIYQNNEKNKKILKESEDFLSKNLNEHGYMNFDISNFLVGLKNNCKMIDSDCIVNLSDPHDNGLSTEYILDNYPQALIIHQKNQTDNKIINPEIFNDFKNEKLPIFICHEDSNSSYIKSTNKCWNSALSERDFEYNRAIQLKVLIGDFIEFTLYACAKINIVNKYSNHVLMNEGGVILVKSPFLLSLIQDKVIDVNSIVMQFNNANKFNHKAFLLYYDICIILNLSPWVCTFVSHPFSCAKRAFSRLGARNIDESQEKQKISFHTFLTDQSLVNVLGKVFIGENFLTGAQFYHMLEILKRIQIYDESLMHRVMDEVAESFFGISTTELNLSTEAYEKENLIKVNISSIPDVVMRQFHARSEQAFYVYNNCVNKKIESKSSNVEKNLVPVFLHVPKNAGTFVISSLTRFFVRIYNGDKFERVQRLQIDDEKFGSFTVHTYFLGDDWRQDDRIRKYKFDAARSRSTDFQTLFSYIKEYRVVILSITMEPVQLNIKTSYEKAWEVCQAAGFEPMNFLLLRDPWSRACSLYNYLSSKSSSHETTHKALKVNSFKEYIHSVFLEDSWIIRTLCNLKGGEPISEDHYNQAVKFLSDNKFFVRDVTASPELLRHVLSKSFKIEVNEDDLIGEKNQSKYSKYLRSDFALEDCEKFAERTKWDQKLYNEFCPKY